MRREGGERRAARRPLTRIRFEATKEVPMNHKTIAEIGPWRVTSRKNRSGNLTVEVELNGVMHADLICQENGTIDLGTTGRPWPLGEQGWNMPGAPSEDWRKFRFAESEEAASEAEAVEETPTTA
jgi:hypothetical protein